MPEDGGYTESGSPARLELSINLLGVDVTELNSVSNEDITIRLADGHVHLMSQAFCSEPVQIGDGEAKVTFLSNTSEQIS